MESKLFDKDGNMLTINEVIEKLPSLFSLEKVTRVEVINQYGRAFTDYNINKTDISLQDNNRTLKIFIS